METRFICIQSGPSKRRGSQDLVRGGGVHRDSNKKQEKVMRQHTTQSTSQRFSNNGSGAKRLSKAMLLCRGSAVLSVSLFTATAAGQINTPADWSPTFALGYENPTIQAYPELTNTDILAPGPFGGPPILALDGSFVGLPDTWAFDDVAHSMGARADIFYFSTNRKSQGLVNTDVRGQANFGQHEGDVFTSSRDGTNTLVVNQADWGMLPAINSDVFWEDAGDNIVSLDLKPEGTGLPTIGGADIVYNLDSNNTMGVSGADILAPGVGVIVGYAALGLLFDDEIDAMHVDNGDIYFSLKRDSISALLNGFSGADVFLSGADGAFSLWATAAQLGLQDVDEIDAIAFTSVPAPASLALLGIGGLAAARRRRA